MFFILVSSLFCLYFYSAQWDLANKAHNISSEQFCPFWLSIREGYLPYTYNDKTTPRVKKFLK